METSVVRQRVLDVLQQTKRPAAERRASRKAQMDQATREYEAFLERIAAPLFKQLAQALRAEGYPFDVFTPGTSVRLMAGRGNDDYIEIVLDTKGSAPKVVGRSRHAHGGDVTETELVLNVTSDIGTLTDEDLLGYLLSELESFVAGRAGEAG
jgi:hypothetical protein